MIDLDAIEARAKAATPGPWWTRTDGDYSADNACVYFNSEAAGYINGSPQSVLIHDEGSHFVADAEFIANARKDIPDLTAEVRRLNAYIEKRERINPEAEIGRLNAKLADIRAKGAPIVEYLESGEVEDMTVPTGLLGPGYLPKIPISIVDVSALVAALEGE